MRGFTFTPPVTLAIAGAACLLLLPACTTSREETPAPGIVIPPHFVAATDAAGTVDEQWWKAFGDPQLDAFVDKAVADSPAIGRSIARVRQAGAQARIAGADRLPQIDAGFGASRQRLTLESLGIVVPSSETPDGPIAYTIGIYDLSANVSWEIDLWGKLSAQSAAARAQFLSSEANLRGVRQGIAAQTARTYFALVEAREQAELARLTAENRAEVARLTANRVEAGSAQPTDGQLAASELGAARARLAQRRETVARLARQLDVLLRDYPDGDVATAAKLPAFPPPPPAGLPVEILARRPDVAASLLDLRAAGFRLTAAEQSLLPSLTLTGDVGTTGTQLSNLLDPDFFIWSIAGRLVQPIFQGGRLRAQIQLRAGERDEALQVHADTVLTALSEVEIALAVEEFLAGQERELAAASTAAERAVEIARNRYDVGKEPLLTLLESQRRALDAGSILLAVRRARLANRIDLHLALGGGFEDAA